MFDPGKKEYQPPVFQGTYQAESDTSSVDTARESTWLDPAQIAELSQKDGQPVFLVRYQYRRGKVILMLGKPNAERGKGLRTCELSNKQMHRYSYSAALGQRGEYLPLGGQSAGCSGGLVGTIRQHMEDMISGEELTDLARLHLIEGPQQGTLRVLRTRATPRAKAVHYLCEAHGFYHKHASYYGVVFKPEYLASVTRKFDMCSWVTWDKASVVHKAPLSALVIQVEPTLRTEELRAQLARTFVNDLAAAAEADPHVSTGYTAAHGAREDEMLTDEMIDSDARDRREAITREAEEAMENLRRQHDASIREARYARHAANDVIHYGRYGAREQQLVDEAIASDTFREGLSADMPRERDEGGRGNQAPLNGLHSRGILEVNLHQRPEHRPVISLALPTASEDNFSGTTQVFQSSRQDQEAASHGSYHRFGLPQSTTGRCVKMFRPQVPETSVDIIMADLALAPAPGRSAGTHHEADSGTRGGDRRALGREPSMPGSQPGEAQVRGQCGPSTSERQWRDTRRCGETEEEVWWCRLFERTPGQLRPGAPNTDGAVTPAASRVRRLPRPGR
ncbi:hypothetical protein CYMTET_38254 [Cymbomonas tetramitiformis]|uniref:Uncharacterized protein n=1 Tax=Cymbomonas tetramitiformis TaxID=36881 RepID=A0AAE0CCB7_9CHLO|nr:hypothetical protein CYMTET_38254 [Cymbomonas tetramitiformis]